MNRPLRRAGGTHRPGRRAGPAGRSSCGRPGWTRGQALRSLIEEFDAQVGAASPATTSGTWRPSTRSTGAREGGLAGLLVCSASDEVTELADRADIVVDGPAGVAALVAASPTPSRPTEIAARPSRSRARTVKKSSANRQK